MDSRRNALKDDWTGCEYAFNVGSVTTYGGLSPIDQIAIKYIGGEGKELADAPHGELADAKIAEDKAKDAGNKIWTAIQALHKKFKADKDSDSKVMGKYTGKEAFAQMDAAAKFWVAKCGIEEHKLEEEAPATAPEGMEMMAMEEMMMEGGATTKFPEEADCGDIAGPAEIPKLLTSMMVCYPVFADAVKAQVMEAELQSAGMVPGVPMPSMSLSLPVPGLEGGADLSSVATITGAYLKAGAADEADSFGCAWLSAEDLEELTEAEAAKDTTVLVFPGATIAWPAQDAAEGAAGEGNGGTKVVYKFKGKVMKPAGDKVHVMYRLFAKIESIADEDGKKVVTLANFADAAFATVKEYSDKVAELKAAAEGAAAAATGDKPADDMMMMDAPMDPPAE